MQQRLVFCCKREVTMTAWGIPECDREDLVFLGVKSGERKWFEVGTVVVTNVAFLIPVWMLRKRRRPADVAAGIGVVVTSTLYHACESLGIEILGMNAGNWHRLDNVFSIFASFTLALLIAGPAAGESLRWLGIVIALVCQERHPWHLACVLGPVLFIDGLAFLSLRWAPSSHRRRLRSPSFVLASLVQGIAVACFVRGLDEDHDPYRRFHGLSHLAHAASAALFIHALDPLPASSSSLGSSEEEIDFEAKKKCQ